MEMSFSKRRVDVVQGHLVHDKHVCMVCGASFGTLDELIAHEDMKHPEVGYDDKQDIEPETEEWDEDENPLSHGN